MRESRLLGDPFKSPVIVPGVAAWINLSNSSLGESLLRDKNKAATPATWAEEVKVPEMILVEEGEPIHDDVMSTPGAKISTHEPYDVNEAVLLFLSDAATANTLAALAGDWSRAYSDVVFPAATMAGMFITNSFSGRSTDGSGPATAKRHVDDGLARVRVLGHLVDTSDHTRGGHWSPERTGP
ncbi:hypothetical protein BG006_002441 [Podila minutissima]|uniref:Uncharacterized protein n=1 Tax=Podila minutissima TaxID=64525 RepID=A0A9P5SBI0_9FUNG|nr:hypothetical protein BG006_002441 [Podila minutissima]